MTENNTYYGIKFPKDFPLDCKNRQQLAGLLFTNLAISAVDAQRILNNKIMFEKISMLCGSFDCIIDNIQVEEKTKYVIVTPVWLTYNILDWITVFTMPKREEVYELCKEYEVSDERLFSELQNAMMNADVHPRIIIDYLKYFGETLCPFQIDDLLDVYNDKIKTVLNQYKPFKCFQNEKNLVQNGK